LFKRIRIAILLYVLLFVAVSQFLSARRSTDWNDTLWVDVFAVNGSETETSERYIESLSTDSFAAIDGFLARESARYGVTLDQPFRVRMAGQLDRSLPTLPEPGSLLGTVIWSLRMRWYVARLHWSRDEPTPDITVFAIYSDGDPGDTLDRSTALRKGLIAVANVFASPHAAGSNEVVIAHELLHTLGATDKYDLATSLPIYPIGFAEPNREPLYPQRSAELMGGRIPLTAGTANIPASLDRVVIGSATAAEIGWIAPGSAAP
jgi:hypothetical protein